MEVLGIDIGFGFTKATDGKDAIVFKSIYGDANDISFWADFGASSPSDHIHVAIDGKSYFVGDLAEQQSSALNFTLDQERMLTDFVRILALTAAGFFLNGDSPVNVPINVVSGLPIAYFKRNHERFTEILAGHHQVTFHNHDGSHSTKEIYINKVRMLPQPLGSVLNLLMDDRGKIVERDLADQKIGVVDIGFRTTDFTIVDHLRYIDRGSRTIDTGMSKAFSIIAGKLQEKCGVNVELYRLYKPVEEGAIKMRGHGFNFAKIRDQVYEQLAHAIAGEIERLWSTDWDIDTIVLTGGGCVDLAAHLQPLLAGHVLPLDPSSDSRLNNVKGYVKYAKFVWGNSGTPKHSAAPPSEAEPQAPVQEDPDETATAAD
jgi:plasmid segregation protein ParM